MIRFLFAFSLVILPYVSKAEMYGGFLSGIWYNSHISRQIEIVDYPDGIRVKAIHNKYIWSWFYRKGLNTYVDDFGDVILQISKYQLIYTSSDKSVRLTYRRYKSSDNFTVRYPDIHSKVDEETDDYFLYQKRDEAFNSDQNNTSEAKAPGQNIPVMIDLNRIEGTWLVKDLDKKVYIVESRDGIKARFTDESKWYTYITQGSENIFVSESGHYYQFKLANGLVWSDKQNNRKFYLHKVSDELID